MELPEIIIRLPFWVASFLKDSPDRFPDVEDRIRFVIALSRQNIRNNTGGPFAAAVFDGNGALVVPGLNLVVASNCSILHAEMVALALAQKILGRYDLSAGGLQQYELCSATEPCAMCLGAIPWSGIMSLTCGARDEDARSVGFDEGHKPADWVSPLNRRGISVKRDVLREEAAAVLREYAASGGCIYNPGI